MKGILFSEPMFKAVIEVRKTKTRRKLIQQPIEKRNDNGELIFWQNLAKPRYKVGETVYIKEPYYFATTQAGSDTNGIIFKFDGCSERFKWIPALLLPEKYARYFIEITAVRCERVQDISDEDCLKEGIIKWCENSFTFEINTDLTKKGGVKSTAITNKTPQLAYARLFDKINRKGALESNLYVWVYSFKLKI